MQWYASADFNDSRVEKLRGARKRAPSLVPCTQQGLGPRSQEQVPAGAAARFLGRRCRANGPALNSISVRRLEAFGAYILATAEARRAIHLMTRRGELEACF